MNAWTHGSFEHYGEEGEGGEWEKYANTAADRLINSCILPMGGARKIGVAIYALQECNLRMRIRFN